MQMIRAPLKNRIWFWLTCWRPCTKYEYRKMWEFILKFGSAIEKDHMKFQKDIAAINMRMNAKRDNKENIERGMYE